MSLNISKLRLTNFYSIVYVCEIRMGLKIRRSRKFREAIVRRARILIVAYQRVSSTLILMILTILLRV